MKRSKFTIADLRKNVEEINESFKDLGINKVFVINGRNGYQAVDAYEMVDGKLECCTNVGCGTSKEVNDYCWGSYRQIVTNFNYNKNKNELERLRLENEKLKTQLNQ
jgi:hypothetical protein